MCQDGDRLEAAIRIAAEKVIAESAGDTSTQGTALNAFNAAVEAVTAHRALCAYCASKPLKPFTVRKTES